MFDDVKEWSPKVNRTVRWLDKRYAALDDVWTSDWLNSMMDIQEVVLPRRGDFLFSDAKNSDARARMTRLVDSTALMANKKAAAGMLTGLMSPARPWLKLGIEGRMGNEPHAERVALDRWRNLMLLIFQEADIYGQGFLMFLESIAFGTAAGIVFPDFDNVIRLETYTCGQYRLKVDHRGRPSELMTESKWLAEEVAFEFNINGRIDHFPYALQKQINENPLSDVTLRHWVGPNRGDTTGGLAQSGKLYASEYWVPSNSGVRRDEDDRFVARRGFDYNPIIAPRWQRFGSREAYGRGPGWDALSDALMLQTMERNNLRALEALTKPALQGPGWANNRKSDFRPGSYTGLDVSRSVGMGEIKPVYTPTIPFDHLEAKEERIRDTIREHFYLDVFNMFSQRNMKDVREAAVEELSAEKLIQLGPIVTSHIVDMLNPLVGATFSIMSDAGLLGDAPDTLAEENLEVQHISILAQAQRALGIQGIDRFTMMIGGMAEIKPDVVDRLDADGLVDEYAEQLGVPARVVRPLDEAEALRKGRQQQSQQMQGLEAAKEAAATAKDLGATPVNDTNAANEILRQVTGGAGGGIV